jgi:hypothetical protein
LFRKLKGGGVLYKKIPADITSLYGERDGKD